MDETNPYRLDKRLARRSFEGAAASYDKAATLQREVGRRLLDRLGLVRMVPRRILDLGAGTGETALGLMRHYRGARIVAVDIAHAMLVRARRRKRWLDRPVCVCADGERLPFGDGSFDLLFSNLMLQWCTEPDSLFAEFRRVLAPGGMLMFTTFGPDTLQELRSSWARVDECTHVNAFADMHDLGDLLVRAGLAEPVMDAERLTVTYGDLHQLMRDLKHMGAHNVTAGRPRGLTGRGRLQRLVDAYEGYRREDGLPASYEVVYGHAWSPQVEGGRSPATVSVELRALRGRTP